METILNISYMTACTSQLINTTLLFSEYNEVYLNNYRIMDLHSLLFLIGPNLTIHHLIYFEFRIESFINSLNFFPKRKKVKFVQQNLSLQLS